MDWKDLINSPNMSRKALIVFMGLAAIWLVIPDAPTDGKTLDPQFVTCVLWAIVSISVMCLCGLACQTVLDWKWPKSCDGNQMVIEQLFKKIAKRWEPVNPADIEEIQKPEA